MRPLPTLLCLAAATSLVALARPARAGSQEAETLFREGRKAAQAGDWATACAKFQDSERLDPAPGTLLNIADCEEHLGRLVKAHEHYLLAGSGFPRGDTRRDFATSHAAAVDKRIARVTLRLAADAPGGAVVHSGDGVLDASTLSSPMLVDPGKLSVVVTAPGRLDRAYTFELHEGDAVEQTLTAGDVAPPAAAPAPAPAPAAPPREDATHGATPWRGGRTLGIVLGSVGAAGIVAGAVTGILTLDRASTVKAHCDATLACDSQGLDAASQGRWLGPTSTTAFVAGGALLAAGAYFFFFTGGSSPAVALSPTIVPGAGGATLHGAF